MLLLVGLGNPGEKYSGTRHNIGFLALDVIALRNGFEPWRSKRDSWEARGKFGDVPVLALKPMTFMNRSGIAVGEVARLHKIPPENVIVFHDEIDLGPGKLRVKAGGGAAGHNGIRSVSEHIGPHFRRVRIGVGHPGTKEQVHGHVLNDFDKADAQWIVPLLDAIADAAPLLTGDDDSAFANKVALILKPPRKTPPPTKAG